MVHCYLCPLKDVCSVPKIKTDLPGLQVTLNWLPDGAENNCPLFKVIKPKK